MNEPNARLMTPSQLLWSRIRTFFILLRRRLPFLVWYGDELDVIVTFPNDTLDSSEPFGSLFDGHLAEIESRLRAAGIEFDRGVGFGGRDWEWDWSLKGPISVQFKSRSTHPERRQERPRPRLVVQNNYGDSKAMQ